MKEKRKKPGKKQNIIILKTIEAEVEVEEGHEEEAEVEQELKFRRNTQIWVKTIAKY